MLPTRNYNSVQTCMQRQQVSKAGKVIHKLDFFSLFPFFALQRYDKKVKSEK